MIKSNQLVRGTEILRNGCPSKVQLIDVNNVIIIDRHKNIDFKQTP